MQKSFLPIFYLGVYSILVTDERDRVCINFVMVDCPLRKY